MSGAIQTPALANDALGGIDTEGFTYLLDNLQADLPGLVETQARMALLNAAREFATKTKAWVDVVQFYLTPNFNQYPIPLDFPYARIVDINAAAINGVPLSPQSTLAGGMIGNFATVGTNTTPVGPPAVYSLISPNILLLTPTPNLVELITVAVAIAPVAQAGALPTRFTEQFFDGLLSGAKARLQSLPGRPYSSAAGAQLNMRIFKQQCQLARAEVLHRYTEGLQEWVFPFFGARKRVQLGSDVPQPSAPFSGSSAVGPAVFADLDWGLWQNVVNHATL